MREAFKNYQQKRLLNVEEKYNLPNKVGYPINKSTPEVRCITVFDNKTKDDKLDVGKTWLSADSIKYIGR